MENNCLVNKQLKLEINGSSNKSKEDAINEAFHDVRKQVSTMMEGTLIYVKPIEVNLKNLQVEEYTEKFLLVLFPRKKERVTITLQITVEVSVIQL